jgi:hypothetical protein
MGAGIGRRDGGYKIEKIVWENPTLAADSFIVTLGDGGNQELFTATSGAVGGARQYDFKPARQWANFRVGTIASGILWIYLRPKYSSFSTSIVPETTLGLAYVDVTVSTAQLLALFTTPVSIIPAPGAGLAVLPIQAVFYLPYVSAAYAGIAVGEDLVFKYTDASGAQIGGIMEPTGFLDQTSNQVRFWNNEMVSVTPVANAAVVLHLLVGNIITGNSPLKLRVYYKVLPTSL